MDLCKTYHELSDSLQIQFFKILQKLCKSHSGSCDCRTVMTDDISADDALTTLLNALRKGADEAARCINFLYKSFDSEARNQKTLDDWIFNKTEVPTASSSDTNSNLVINTGESKRNVLGKSHKYIPGKLKQRAVTSISKTISHNDGPKINLKDNRVKPPNKQTSPVPEALCSPSKTSKISTSPTKTPVSVPIADHNLPLKLSPIVRLIDLPLFKTTVQNQAINEHLNIREKTNSNISCSELQNPCISEVSESTSRISIHSNSSALNSEKELPAILNQTSKEELKKNRKDLRKSEVTKVSNENSSIDLKSNEVVSPYNLRRKRANNLDSKIHAKVKSTSVNVTSSRSGNEEINTVTETEEFEASTNLSEDNETVLTRRIKTGTTVQKNLSVTLSQNKSGKIKCKKSSETAEIETAAENVGDSVKLQKDIPRDVTVIDESILNEKDKQNSSELVNDTVKQSVDLSFQRKFEAYCKVKQACATVGLNLLDIFQSKGIESLMKDLKELQSDGLAYLGNCKVHSSGKIVPIVHVHESKKELLEVLSKIKKHSEK